jgi:hypothetical protein
MNASQPTLVIKSFKNVNVTRHIEDISNQFVDRDGHHYCKCSKQPTVVPIKRSVNGETQTRYVAMCNTCMPGGAMHLSEFKTAFQAIDDFNQNARLSLDVSEVGVQRYAM